MAIAIGQVQADRVNFGPTVTTASVTTQSSGSTFVVFVMTNAARPLGTVTDSKGNTFSQTGSGQLSTGEYRYAYVCENGTGGSGHTVTVTTAGSENSSIWAVLVEITGGLTSGILDDSDFSIDGTSPFVDAGVTTTVDNVLLLAFCSGQNNAATNTHTAANGTKISENTNGSTAYPTYAVSSRIVSSTGTYNESWTTSSTTTSAACFMLAFKENSGGGATPTGRGLLLGVG